MCSPNVQKHLVLWFAIEVPHLVVSFFFWQNGPLTDVQEDEEMDTKKDDEDEDDEQEQEAKSANLLRRIKHQKAPTSGHR